MQIVFRSNLEKLITALCQRGARPLTVRMETTPKLLKKNRENGTPTPVGWVGMVKRSTVNGFLNFDYANSVNLQRAREGTAANFEARPNWFEHIPFAPTPLVRSKKDTTKLYLQLKSENPLSATYETAEGEAVSRATLAPYLPTKASPAASQGVEKAVLTFTVSLENIVAITCDGETYAIATENAPLPFAATLAKVSQI